MLALGTRLLGDFGVDELAHHVQADRHRRGQQALAHAGGERFELLAHLPGQPLRQRRILEVNHADLGQQPQAARRRPLRVRRLHLHWWSSVLNSVRCENPERASRHERGGGPPLNFYDAWVNLTVHVVSQDGNPADREAEPAPGASLSWVSI
jgi:hypothetical protein